MKLLLDAGNTRVKLSWMAPGADARVDEVVSFGYDDSMALQAWIQSLPGRPSQAWGASVVEPGRMLALEQLLEAAVGHPLPIRWLAGQARAAGVLNAYEPAQGLGADRWAALLGLAGHARRKAGCAAPVLLASFGTATTLDALLPLPDDPVCDYVFPGGVILPGVALMRRSLVQGTARLPDEPGAVQAFPRQTRDAIATGVAAAQAGAVWRQWRLLSRVDGAPAQLYVTGGAWSGVESEVRSWFESCPPVWLAAPVLDGLACLVAGSTHGT